MLKLVLVIIKVARNFHRQGLFKVNFYITWCGIAGSCDKHESFLTFKKLPDCFQSDCTILHSDQQCIGVPSAPHKTSAWYCLFVFVF